MVRSWQVVVKIHVSPTPRPQLATQNIEVLGTPLIFPNGTTNGRGNREVQDAGQSV
jgi:hypothetical protein